MTMAYLSTSRFLRRLAVGNRYIAQRISCSRFINTNRHVSVLAKDYSDASGVSKSPLQTLTKTDDYLKRRTTTKIASVRPFLPHTTRAFSTKDKNEHATEGDTLIGEYEAPTTWNHTQVTDPEEFRRAASKTLKRLADSIENLKVRNDFVEIELSPENDYLEVDLGPYGKCTVQVDNKHRCISMLTPYSGCANAYFLSETTGQWLEWNDHHELEELFVGDLSQLCKGMPSL